MERLSTVRVRPALPPPQKLVRSAQSGSVSACASASQLRRRHRGRCYLLAAAPHDGRVKKLMFRSQPVGITRSCSM